MVVEAVDRILGIAIKRTTLRDRVDYTLQTTPNDSERLLVIMPLGHNTVSVMYPQTGESITLTREKINDER